MSPILEIEGLCRTFGTVVANDGISLRVQRGEVFGLLGHNGAGKTTIVSQIVGLLRPDAGSIHVGEIDAIKDPAEARRRVALQLQAQTPMDGLTPQQAIEMSARLRGSTAAQARRAATDLAERLQIEPWFTQRALPEGRGLSGGVRRLTGFAMAVAGRSPLIVLDEPSNDVDAARRRALWATVRQVADEGAGVLLVTHNVLEAERVVDELVVLDRGRVVASGTPGTLRGDDGLRLEITLVATRNDPTETPETVPLPVRSRVRSGRRVWLSVPSDAAAAAVGWAAGLRDQSVIDSYALTPTTLEDTYLAITEPANEQPAA